MADGHGPMADPISVVEVGAEETPLIILFHRDADGELSASIRGYMDPGYLVKELRHIADHIEAHESGHGDAPAR